jgi:hypothetical protein
VAAEARLRGTLERCISGGGELEMSDIDLGLKTTKMGPTEQGRPTSMEQGGAGPARIGRRSGMNQADLEPRRGKGRRGGAAALGPANGGAQIKAQG